MSLVFLSLLEASKRTGLWLTQRLSPPESPRWPVPGLGVPVIISLITIYSKKTNWQQISRDKAVYICNLAWFVILFHPCLFNSLCFLINHWLPSVIWNMFVWQKLLLRCFFSSPLTLRRQRCHILQIHLACLFLLFISFSLITLCFTVFVPVLLVDGGR